MQANDKTKSKIFRGGSLRRQMQADLAAASFPVSGLLGVLAYRSHHFTEPT